MALDKKTPAVALVKRLRKSFPRIQFFVEENWDGENYIRAISDPGYTPDLQKVIPDDWIVLPWGNPDHRAHLTSITRRI